MPGASPRLATPHPIPSHPRILLFLVHRFSTPCPPRLSRLPRTASSRSSPIVLPTTLALSVCASRARLTNTSTLQSCRSLSPLLLVLLPARPPLHCRCKRADRTLVCVEYPHSPGVTPRHIPSHPTLHRPSLPSPAYPASHQQPFPALSERPLPPLFTACTYHTQYHTDSAESVVLYSSPTVLYVPTIPSQW
ncbi:hypothetical protein B0H14DRAFT_2994075 [Mycena olivaceomarginata]|nr:hypothetical protein B0H14DRAFT_2994075 [Mycena olivaceomarginata]